MSTEVNKTVLRRIYEEVFNKGNLAAVDESTPPTLSITVLAAWS